MADIEKDTTAVEEDIQEVPEEALLEEYADPEEMYYREQLARAQARRNEVLEIVDSVKEKHKGKRLYFADVPYAGLFIFSQQTHADVREVNRAVSEYTDQFLSEKGGAEKVQGMSEKERARITRQLDNDIADMSNELTLKRCVVYPEDFAASLDDGSLPSGVASLLLEKIMEVSGWSEVIVEEA